MDEKDLFNKDTMYWREVNAISPNLKAEITLNQSVEIEGGYVDFIACFLLPFESADVVYEMENGGAFKKHEVKSWPYVNLKDFEFFQDESNSEQARKAKVRIIDHDKVQAITLTDEKGDVILTKAKI